MKKKRVAEALKTVLIVALAVSAVLLARRTGLFDEFFASLSRTLRQEQDSVQVSQTNTGEACRPLAIMLTGESGLRCCVRYSDKSLDEVYEKLENMLGEALGSSSEPKPVSEDEIRDLLNKTGVFFDFQTLVPLHALADWLGSEMLHVNEDSATCVLLSQDDKGMVILCYIDGNRKAWQCETASTFAPLGAKISEYQPNGAEFAFENNNYLELDPYCIICPGEVEFPSAAITVPSVAEMEKVLLEAFGLERYAGNSYPESDGTTVFVGDGETLRISANGEAVFRVTELYGNSDTGQCEAIELARRVASKSAGVFAGDSRIYLSSFERLTDGGILAEFGYVIGGIRVAGTEAVSVEIHGDKVTQAYVCIRTSALGDSVTLLPQPQAAAIAQAEIPGGMLLPRYTECSEGLVPVWTVE